MASIQQTLVRWGTLRTLAAVLLTWIKPGLMWKLSWDVNENKYISFWSGGMKDEKILRKLFFVLWMEGFYVHTLENARTLIATWMGCMHILWSRSLVQNCTPYFSKKRCSPFKAPGASACCFRGSDLLEKKLVRVRVILAKTNVLPVFSGSAAIALCEVLSVSPLVRSQRGWKHFHASVSVLTVTRGAQGLKSMVEKPSVPPPRQHTATLHHCFKFWYLLGVSQLGVTHAWLASVFQDSAGDIQNTTCLQHTEVDYYVTSGRPHIWRCVEIWRLRLVVSLADYLSAQRLCAPMWHNPSVFTSLGCGVVEESALWQTTGWMLPTRHSSWSHSRLWRPRNWVCWVTPQNPPPHEHATRAQRWDRAPPQQMAPHWEDTCGEEITAYGWDNAVPDSTPPTMFIMSCSWCSLPCLRSCWMCFD